MKRGMLFLLFAVLLSGQAFAQSQVQTQAPPESLKSHWGVSVSFAPKWEFLLEPVKELLDFKRIDVSGSEFRIGFVRGRELSGDWGISYLRKRFDRNSLIDDIGSSSGYCTSEPGGGQLCLEGGQIYYLKKVVLNGIEAHKFWSFGTIKQRVQVGMNLAGGAAWFDGTVEKQTFRPEFVFDAARRTFVLRQNKTTTNITAKEAFSDIGWPEKVPFPTGKLELVGAVITAPGLKLKASGGLNLLGYHRFSISAVYLFGTRR